MKEAMELMAKVEDDDDDRGIGRGPTNRYREPITFVFGGYAFKDSENNAKDKKVCREQLKHVLRHGSVTSIDFAKKAQTPIRRLKSFGNN